MRELRLAVHPSIDPAPRVGGGERAGFPLSRGAFVASVLVHLAGAYAVSRVAFVVDEPPLVAPKAEFVWLSERVPLPPLRESPRVIEAPPAPAVVEAPTETESRERRAEPSLPQQRVATEAAPEVIVPEPAPPAAVESAPVSAPGPLVEPRIDFDEERRRAAAEIIEERAREDSYLTFSIDDVAPPRPVAEPGPKRSIFDGTGEPIGPKVGQLGQARTKFGHRLSELCNALTGGFSLMGFGSFCAPPSDGEPSGLFPEVRPAYLDLLPECSESQPEQPELATASPFSTVKCRLVQQELPARGPPR